MNGSESFSDLALRALEKIVLEVTGDDGWELRPNHCLVDALELESVEVLYMLDLLNGEGAELSFIDDEGGLDMRAIRTLTVADVTTRLARAARGSLAVD